MEYEHFPFAIRTRARMLLKRPLQELTSAITPRDRRSAHQIAAQVQAMDARGFGRAVGSGLHDNRRGRAWPDQPVPQELGTRCRSLGGRSWLAGSPRRDADRPVRERGAARRPSGSAAPNGAQGTAACHRSCESRARLLADIGRTHEQSRAWREREVRHVTPSPADQQAAQRIAGRPTGGCQTGLALA